MSASDQQELLRVSGPKLRELGPKTAAQIDALEASEGQHELVLCVSLLASRSLSWSDDELAAVLDALQVRLAERELSPDVFAGWLGHHAAEADAVRDLIELRPPPDVTVVRRMSQLGSQKVVYEARWREGQAVVLKRFVDEGTAPSLLKRELEGHPLTMEHPNIIRTHVLTNDLNQQFLAEKKLAQVLADDWRAPGAAEAANLLHDIASALQYLHGRGLVHGDVKPDNLGYEGGRYILLDLGVCRPADEFEPGASATGSLRTRAPEILLGEEPHSLKSDVWALAATVYCSLLGAFPLFEANEDIPRVSNADERERKVVELQRRAREEFEARVMSRLGQSVEHRSLRTLLRGALARDPESRPSAGELAASCRRELLAFIRSDTWATDLARDEQLAQLELYLPDGDLTKALPWRRLMQLQATLSDLANAELDEQQRRGLAELSRRAGLSTT